MLELTWKDLNSMGLQASLNKLYSATGLDAVTSARVDRIVDAANSAMKWAMKKQRHLADLYCVKNDKGEPLMENDSLKFNNEEDEKKYQEEFAKMMETGKVEIKVHKLDWHLLQDCKVLSAMDIAILKKDFIAGMPEGDI